MRSGDVQAACVIPLIGMLLIAVLAAVTPAPVAVAADGVRAGRVTSAPAFPVDGQGVYESCSPAADPCVEHLNELSAGGF